jgi:hypothetical protein
MTMDLRWLNAPDSEIASAMATARREARPKWVPTRRRVLVHVNHSLILWYLCVVLLVFGIRVDSYDGGQVSGSVLRGLLIAGVILAVWLCGSVWLYSWSKRPPSPRARINEWRQALTALANGFEPQSSRTATFSSLITTAPGGVRIHPRFVAPGVEFGNLVQHGPSSRSDRTAEWNYLAVTLPAPMPHLVLDATSNDGVRSDLPVGVDRGQKLSLEGDFDRWFRAYSPVTYRVDALYVLTPDVMAALIDDASAFNVEIVDHTLVFFTPGAADFTKATPWNTVQAVLTNVAVRIVASAARYRDERVPGQETAPVINKIRAELEHPEIPWVAPPARIGPDGRRLDVRDRRTGVWSVIGAVGWFLARTLLYAVPGIFAFAGFMSIVDGW